MEQQIGINGQNGLEWQIILTDNEAVIVRRSTPLVTPAKPTPMTETAQSQTATPVQRTTPNLSRIYANMR